MYRALIVCNYNFPAAQGSLRDLQGPKRDGLLLRDALTDHDTGMFEKANVRDPLNDATSGDILEAVEEFFESAEPEDTLLFYYSGHGRSRDQELYLCARNTDLSKLRSTAVSGKALKDIIGSNSSLARVKILVLDCCYSALFKGDDDPEIAELFGTGRYVLAATSAAERAADGAQKGVPSPFTKALTDALVKQAKDLDGDGKVDLDDVYRYLKTVSFDGARPHQNFEGAGTIPIARRAASRARDNPQTELGDDGSGARTRNPHTGMSAGRDTFSAARDLYITYPGATPDPDLSYLDRPVSGFSFSPALVAEFRRGMRKDVRERMPDSLTDAQFLDRAGLLTRDGSITYAGLLLFGAHPTQVLPSAVVQCVRFHGTTKTAPREITDFHDPIPQLIAKAYDFVADVARTGDTPTDSGPRAEPVYRYPMVAVRELIANAVVHRDYENQKSCVQIHAFDDRIEVHSPGAWQGAAVAPGTHPLGELARASERRNFRIAQPLTWSRLMEGAGTGVARSVEECGKAGAQEPLVANDNESVRVTLFPRRRPPVPLSETRQRFVTVLGALLPNLLFEEDEARTVLEQIGRQRARQSEWQNARSFWDSELRRLELGAIPDGVERLVSAVYNEYPGNSALAALVAELSRGNDAVPPTQYHTFVLSGSDQYDRFLRLIRAQVDGDAEQCYVTSNQSAVLTRDPGPRVDEIQERMIAEVSGWEPGGEVRVEHRVSSVRPTARPNA